MLEHFQIIQHIREPLLVAEIENAMEFGPAEVGIDQQNAPAIESQAAGEIAGDGGFAVAGRWAGDENRSRGIERGAVLKTGANLSKLFGHHGMRSLEDHDR